MRRINTETLALIKQWEGCRLTSYKDVAGIWTIGYGHTRTAKQNQTISQVDADNLLMLDLEEFQDAVSRLVKVGLTDNQYGALVSFAFNVGAGAFERSTLLRKLNAGDYDSVPGQLMRWNKARVGGKMVPVQGLTNRRAAEAGLWARGAHVAGREAGMAEDRPGTLADAVKTDTGMGASVPAMVATVTPLVASLQGLDWRVGVALALIGVLSFVGVLIWRSKRD